MRCVRSLSFLECARAVSFSLTLFIFFTALYCISSAKAGTAGRARVIDGDTIEIQGKRIRLFGIDAPESRQTCSQFGKPWPCGQKSTFALANLLKKYRINCIERDRDRYQRLVAICYRDNLEINAEMVRQGWAVDYQRYSKGIYSKEETEAKSARRGIWAGEFIKPADWRHGRRLTNYQNRTKTDPSSRLKTDCLIKGNISSGGKRIYHIPGDKFYSRTLINTLKGERWFCTEAEAQAAGWRRSKW